MLVAVAVIDDYVTARATKDAGPGAYWLTTRRVGTVPDRSMHALGDLENSL